MEEEVQVPMDIGNQKLISHSRSHRKEKDEKDAEARREGFKDALAKLIDYESTVGYRLARKQAELDREYRAKREKFDTMMINRRRRYFIKKHSRESFNRAADGLEEQQIVLAPE